MRGIGAGSVCGWRCSALCDPPVRGFRGRGSSATRREGAVIPRKVPERERSRGLSGGVYALLYAAYLGAALTIYAPALSGPFVSDDLHYVATNPYVHQLDLASVRTLFEPYGGATVAVVNYAPLQMLLHAVAWQAFGPEVLGHHVLNVALHALASLLLVPLFLASGIPLAGALLGSLLFLVHPANVEAVAWISQLKTSLAMVFTLFALLANGRRPGFASGLFGLALLAKATAAVAAPVAFVLEWLRSGRVRWRYVAIWSALFALYAAIEFTAHQRSGAVEAVLYDTPLVLVRTVLALGLRYLAMAATSFGVSAFHEPEPAAALDPWWLGAVLALAAIGWRALWALRARREEFAYWAWALISFGPISQVFPFLYPMADRYLYFILPGLLGAVLLVACDLLARVSVERRSVVARAAVALGIALAIGFAAHSRGRAAIWRSPATILADASRHYPDGVSANLLRAKRSAQGGDADAAVASLRRAMARGYNRYEQLLGDPGFLPIRDTAGFRAVIHEIAGGWIEAGKRWQDPSQLELHKLADAHAVREEREQALAYLRRALDVGGPLDDAIRSELRAAQR